MRQALDGFNQSVVRVRALGALYVAVYNRTTGVLDASDMLRAQVVLVVSALDYYIHEVTRLGMQEISAGSRPPTDAYLRWGIQISDHIAANTPGAGTSWLDDAIRREHSWKSFQHPDKIADAIRLIPPVPLWHEVGTRLGRNHKDVKRDLVLIVDRRNKIAHEADIDPSFPGTRWPISTSIATGSVDYVERVVTTIHDIVA